jgi:hypothetical protein
MNKKFEKDNFIDIISEGIFNKLAQAVSGLGRKITQPPPEPTMLKPWTRKSQYPGNKRVERRITPLNPSAPEARVGMGGTLLMPPKLVEKIWPKKRIEQQQKEFFINVFAGDAEAKKVLKQGIDPILCGKTNVILTRNEYEQFDSAIIQFVDAKVLDERYKKLSQDVYKINFGNKDPEQSPKSETDLSGFCKTLEENKSLYASLLELGPSAQGLGSYDERFELPTGIDRAEDSGLLNFSDNTDACNDNNNTDEEEQEEISLNFSR